MDFSLAKEQWAEHGHKGHGSQREAGCELGTKMNNLLA